MKFQPASSEEINLPNVKVMHVLRDHLNILPIFRTSGPSVEKDFKEIALIRLFILSKLFV